jgi:hypothetical protein
MERRKVAKSEKQYLRGIIHNLSLQKWTDQDIVEYLRDEKSIDIGRSTVTKIKNQIEKEAEKWYIELRQSTYKYIATYKERMDSLLSYQKNLHDIICDTKKDEVKIRAISELHSIEMDLFNLWKQLPDLDIVDQERVSNPSPNHNVPPVDYGEPIVGYDTEPWGSSIDDEPKPKPEEKPIEIAASIVSAASEVTDKQERKDRDGEEDGWKLLKCPTCSKSFYNNFTLSAHQCNSKPTS